MCEKAHDGVVMGGGGGLGVAAGAELQQTVTMEMEILLKAKEELQSLDYWVGVVQT